MKIFKRIASGTSAAVLMLSTLMTMGFTGVAHAAGKDTGFAVMAAHPGATLGLIIFAAGIIFVIARTNRKPAPVRARVSRSKRR